VGLAPHLLDLGSAAALAEADRRELHALLEREAVLLGAALVVELENAVEPGDPRRIRPLVEGWIERLGAALVLVSRERWQTDHPVDAFRVPRMAPAERTALWRAALDGTALAAAAALERVAQHFDLGPRAMRDAAGDARARAARRGAPDGAPTEAELWDACRERAATALEDLAQRVDSPYGWDDIVLGADPLAQLREIAGQVERRAQVYEEWGFSRQLARGRGVTALFSGPSGTGKTMAAEILANHLRLDLFRVDLSGVVSKWVGETEKTATTVTPTSRWTTCCSGWSSTRGSRSSPRTAARRSTPRSCGGCGSSSSSPSRRRRTGGASGSWCSRPARRAGRSTGRRSPGSSCRAERSAAPP
jgi:hypothetical protein